MFFLIKQFFDELFRPKLKCDRVGHNINLTPHVIRKRSKWPTVVHDYYCNIPECSRCGHMEDPVNLSLKDGWHACEMADYKWTIMDANGYLIID